MTEDDQVRQDLDRPAAVQSASLSPEEEAARIEKLKASHRSHHTAGGCAEDQPEPKPPQDTR